MDIFIPSNLFTGEVGKKIIREMVKEHMSTDVIFDDDEPPALEAIVEAARSCGEEKVADYLESKYMKICEHHKICIPK